MIEVTCALCGNNKNIETLYESTFNEDDISYSTYSARRLPDRVHYRIVKCKKCNLVFSSPILSPTKIVSLYKDAVFTYHETAWHLAKTYWNLFKKIPIISSKTKVLDIGCGDGFFLSYLAEKGLENTIGVEPSVKVVSQAPDATQKKIIRKIFNKNLFQKRSFDIVCCFHTLDHIIDPNQFLEDTYNVLKPDGYALFVVHNVDSYGAKLFNDAFPIFDIEHIYLFNKTTLQEIFKKHGFKEIQILSVKNTYPLDYWITMSPIPKSIKEIIKWLGRNIPFLKTPISFYPGNIAIIAKK